MSHRDIFCFSNFYLIVTTAGSAAGDSDCGVYNSYIRAAAKSVLRACDI